MPFWKTRSRKSLDTWARREFNARKSNIAPTSFTVPTQDTVWQANKGRRVKDIYRSYQATNPGLDTGPRLNQAAKDTMLDNISHLSSPTVNVYGQGRAHNDTPSFIRDNAHQRQRTNGTWANEAPLGNRASNLFAYRINPVNPQGSTGRFTINSRQDQGLQLAQALEHEVNPATKKSFVTQSKMKGIDRLGQKTDDAIVYFNSKPSWNQRRKMAKRIRSNVQTTDYTPQGMDRIKPGVSWAQRPQHVDPTKPAYSTSHGTAHATIIEAAIRSTAKHYGNNMTQANFDKVYSYKLKRAGLNANNPARLKQRTAPIKKPWESRFQYMKRRWG
ncbi:T3SS effector HopA1 family protein [Aliikangiella coralliicola]|uniref:Uncharacterized protein n=1 Tax=Aliikangiella coralliicola TaxID=2592383 RepID=A0A545UE52_9GAMM|nr:T3SS effector HopA1 family protein [Aliikangiella coralliicola]TQV87754.1 hypothetical protein FLL46_10230 [Aliikangiella coralliicola]